VPAPDTISMRYCLLFIFLEGFFASLFSGWPFPTLPKQTLRQSLAYCSDNPLWGDSSGPLALGSHRRRGRRARPGPDQAEEGCCAVGPPIPACALPRNIFRGCPGLCSALCRGVLAAEWPNRKKAGRSAGSCWVWALCFHWDRPSQASHRGLECLCLLTY